MQFDHHLHMQQLALMMGHRCLLIIYREIINEQYLDNS